MHIQKIRTTIRGKTYSSTLLRESYREAGKVKKRTLANLSHLPPQVIELIRNQLNGRTYIDAQQHFEVIESRQHGAVAAVLTAFEQLDMMRLISSTASRQRNLVAAMIVARLIRPHTKLAPTRWWRDTTIVDEFDIADATVDELYGALDWLVKRQSHIQSKLARRHLKTDDLVLYDLSSSYLEGSCCTLARRGYSRDGKRGKLQVCYGLLCDVRGRPIAVSVHPGNTRDHHTLLEQINDLQQRYGLERVVIVGDRGMITQTRIKVLQSMPAVEWITALRSSSIGKLVRDGSMDLSQFDEVNLFEVLHPDYPGERLVACRNSRLATHRATKREALLEATESDLAAIAERVTNGTLQDQSEIGVAVGQCINRYRMKKHFGYQITDQQFTYWRHTEKIAQEAALDGIYIIRTSLDATDLDAADCVRTYKSLTRVERAFRSLKTMSLNIRPIHHRLADRVRAHIFLCTLAYYVQWHMREAWRELLFADPQLHDDTTTRDPVAPAERSPSTRRKASSAKLDDGSDAYCFATLMAHLNSITRNRCRAMTATSKQGPLSDNTFEMTTTPNKKQRQALELLKNIGTIN